MLLQFLKVLSHKWQGPHHHPVQKYSPAPYINPRAIIGLVQEELRGGIECAQLMAYKFTTGPKSASKSMFSGFRSLWTMPL